LKYKY